MIELQFVPIPKGPEHGHIRCDQFNLKNFINCSCSFLVAGPVRAQTAAEFFTSELLYTYYV